METKEVIDNMIDDILAGENTTAREKFDAAIASKLADAIDAKKLEVAQSIYGEVPQDTDSAEDIETEDTEETEETDEDTETSEG